MQKVGTNKYGAIKMGVTSKGKTYYYQKDNA